MKRILKKISVALVFMLITVSCTQDDGINIILQPDPQGIEFTNTLSTTYLLSTAAATNVAERLVWKPVDFGAPIDATFRLEGSIDQSSFSEISTSSENNIAIAVGDLLDLATELGLDEDKGTTDEAGNPNNIGVVYFRIIGFSGGNGAANAEQVTSEVITMNIELIESGDEPLEPIMISNFGVVGELVNEWGATPDIPLYTRESGALFASVDVVPNGPFNIRADNDWVTSYGPDGDSDLQLNPFGVSFSVTEDGPYLVEFDLSSLTYEITKKDSWGLVGENINNWGEGFDIRLTEDPDQEGLWIALAVEIPTGPANFRLNNEWNSILSPVEEGSNILGLNLGFGPAINLDAGTYNITLDIRNQEEITVDFEIISP